ncbi:UV DNA damage repair endonuclease UvsE [Roseisolibacter sp. H3M3-2]|uniref:UV DNA damage repair endonuclease UvsE n=1 Tax=Roseisolibacter sp. H3M3-2 TaxID=3031323 RepID=UPI0023DC99C6|nr:UV DNA damage repair endonuclease UvsE [Roseisolibacter sp. H3M3-2]MDF1504083.1 UV DNA damage repair endonuclease UvsE [Roseisolibacter sp. H3M3-2]
MIRWGLCCQFLDAPIRFRTATHRYVSGLDAGARRAYLAGIARDNAAALAQAVDRCHALGIGAFRINSQILPLATHPVTGYALADLEGPDAEGLEAAFAAIAPHAARCGIRLSLHPDQFVVLNSEREAVREASRRELEFQCWVAETVGADVVTLHVGGATGGKEAALERLARAVDTLSPRARARLALENDDRLFSPADLLPFCARTGLPLVYDSHHHRCNPDALSVEEATLRSAGTWGAREPYFHVSSPRDGWDARNPRPHADYLDPADLPPLWRGMPLTVDVEAKAKERAVLAIMGEVGARPVGAV